MHLAVGDRVEYEFSATEPVDFNIHYHEGNAVVAPIGREKVYADSGFFVAADRAALLPHVGGRGGGRDARLPRAAARAALATAYGHSPRGLPVDAAGRTGSPPRSALAASGGRT